METENKIICITLTDKLCESRSVFWTICCKKMNLIAQNWKWQLLVEPMAQILSKLHFHFSATETTKQVLGSWVVIKTPFFIIHHDSHHYSHTALWWDTASSSCAYQYHIACRIPVLWRAQALKVLLHSMTKQIELGQFIDHQRLAPLSLQALNCRNLINDLVHF